MLFERTVEEPADSPSPAMILLATPASELVLEDARLRDETVATELSGVLLAADDAVEAVEGGGHGGAGGGGGLGLDGEGGLGGDG